jgi:hypothetical protein
LSVLSKLRTQSDVPKLKKHAFGGEGEEAEEHGTDSDSKCS